MSPRGLADWSAGRGTGPRAGGCQSSESKFIDESPRGRQPEPFGVPARCPNAFTSGIQRNSGAGKDLPPTRTTLTRPAETVERRSQKAGSSCLSRDQRQASGTLSSSSQSLMRIISSLAGLSIQVFWIPAQFSQMAQRDWCDDGSAEYRHSFPACLTITFFHRNRRCSPPLRTPGTLTCRTP
jgi:hypothetical protein